MTTTIPIRVQHKHMTQAEWHTSSLVLLKGEIGVESDTGMLKVGDGLRLYRELSYLTGSQGPQGERGLQGVPGRDGVVTFEQLTPEQRQSLKGDKGDRGERGLQGPQGERGLQGLTGATGAKGDRGLQGIPGQNGTSIIAQVVTSPPSSQANNVLYLVKG